ncbi:MAG: hypothetical protein ACI9FJ_001660 [Alteromonadaceae bacterium]|jgi:hypothetical protein
MPGHKKNSRLPGGLCNRLLCQKQCHRRWENKRIKAINSPRWIKLNSSDFDFIANPEPQANQRVNKVIVKFWLHYQTPGYADKTHKKLTLRFKNKRWLITNEQNLQVNR